jgi:hypothetical protein
MAELMPSEKLVRDTILKVFPASNGFGEKTLESLARGVDPGIRPNPNALSMNLGEIAQEIHQYIPAITDLIKLGSAAFVAWKAGTAAAPPTAPDIASEVLRRLSEQGGWSHRGAFRA